MVGEIDILTGGVSALQQQQRDHIQNTKAMHQANAEAQQALSVQKLEDYKNSASKVEYCSSPTSSGCKCTSWKTVWNEALKAQSVAAGTEAGKQFSLAKIDSPDPKIASDIKNTAEEKRLKVVEQQRLENAWANNNYAHIDPALANQVANSSSAIRALESADESSFDKVRNYARFRRYINVGRGPNFNSANLERLKVKDQKIASLEAQSVALASRDLAKLCSKDNNNTVGHLFNQLQTSRGQVTTTREQLNNIDNEQDISDKQNNVNQLFKRQLDESRKMQRMSAPLMLIRGNAGVPDAMIDQLDELEVAHIQLIKLTKKMTQQRRAERLNLDTESQKLRVRIDASIKTNNKEQFMIEWMEKVSAQITNVQRNIMTIRQITQDLEVWSARVHKYTSITVVNLLQDTQDRFGTQMDEIYGVVTLSPSDKDMMYSFNQQENIVNSIKKNMNLFVRFVTQSQVAKQSLDKFNQNARQLLQVTKMLANSKPSKEQRLIDRLKTLLKKNAAEQGREIKNQALEESFKELLAEKAVNDKNTPISMTMDNRNQSLSHITKMKIVKQLDSLNKWTQTFSDGLEMVRQRNYTAFIRRVNETNVGSENSSRTPLVIDPETISNLEEAMDVIESDTVTDPDTGSMTTEEAVSTITNVTQTLANNAEKNNQENLETAIIENVNATMPEVNLEDIFGGENDIFGADDDDIDSIFGEDWI